MLAGIATSCASLTGANAMLVYRVTWMDGATTLGIGQGFRKRRIVL
jgi:hypothetical protein